MEITKEQVLEKIAVIEYSNVVGLFFEHDGAGCSAWELDTFDKDFNDMDIEDYRKGAILLHIMMAKKIYDRG